MLKISLVIVAFALFASGCEKQEPEKVTAQESQLKMQADKARIDLQEKADALARNPPPELIQAAKEQAAKEAEQVGK